MRSKANKWQGRNITRWQNAEYDELFHASESELDPVKRAALFIAMNDMVINDRRGHPGRLPARRVGASPRTCTLPLTGWDSTSATCKDWYRTT